MKTGHTVEQGGKQQWCAAGMILTTQEHHRLKRVHWPVWHLLPCISSSDLDASGPATVSSALIVPCTCCTLAAGWCVSCHAADVVCRTPHHGLCQAQHQLSTARHRQQRQPTHSADHGAQGGAARHWGRSQQMRHVLWQVRHACSAGWLAGWIQALPGCVQVFVAAWHGPGVV